MIQRGDSERLADTFWRDRNQPRLLETKPGWPTSLAKDSPRDYSISGRLLFSRGDFKIPVSPEERIWTLPQIAPTAASSLRMACETVGERATHSGRSSLSYAAARFLQ